MHRPHEHCVTTIFKSLNTMIVSEMHDRRLKEKIVKCVTPSILFPLSTTVWLDIPAGSRGSYSALEVHFCLFRFFNGQNAGKRRDRGREKHTKKGTNIQEKPPGCRGRAGIPNTVPSAKRLNRFAIELIDNRGRVTPYRVRGAANGREDPEDETRSDIPG